MAFPAFFDQAPLIALRDPLADFLGAAEDGRIDYRYTDVVRVAGHSCPTVAGAWLMARAALAALYPGATPERGAIEVTMAGAEDEGTTGVIAQVFTLVTGATDRNGFHGIAGRFVRRGLLHYGGRDVHGIARFRRVDTGAGVHVSLDVSGIPGDPRMRMLMGQSLDPDAPAEVRKAFGAVWQDRVRRLLLDHADDPQVIQLMPA